MCVYHDREGFVQVGEVCPGWTGVCQGRGGMYQGDCVSPVRPSDGINGIVPQVGQPVQVSPVKCCYRMIHQLQFLLVKMPGRDFPLSD